VLGYAVSMGELDRKRQALALWEQGQRQHLAGDIASAIRIYTRSIEIFPTAEAYTFRGWAYSFQGRIEEAIEECKGAIRLDPDLGNPYNDIGSYLMKLGRLDEAVPWLERAKEARRYEPRHFPYLNLGRLFASQGLLCRAIEEFEGALRFDPNNAFALRALDEINTTLN
jgi:tetratricopeptide (TPR) repeat protein